MALDDVVRTTITGPRIEEAMYRTLRWIDRCIAGKYTPYKFLDLFVSLTIHLKTPTKYFHFSVCK